MEAEECDCQACRPDVALDQDDRYCIESVKEQGFQVVFREAVSGDPAFAYTVGLGHEADHPELVISGQRTQLMYGVLNEVAARVVEGHPLSPGAEVEGVLPLVPLLCEELETAVAERIISHSRWFHRRPAVGLQLVWPDTGGRFAWQPGAGHELAELQPSTWRKAGPHVGPFAVDPRWPLPVSPDKSVLVCTHVSEGEAIGFVAREPDDRGGEEWIFHCGRAHVWSPANLVAWHIAHVIRSAPSIWKVADLRIGEDAWRSGPGSPWQRHFR